jgi:cytochrome P450
MLEGWEHSARQGEPVDVDAEMMRLALEVVGKALFSVDLSAEAGELTGAVLTSLDHLIHRSRNPFSPPDFIPTSRNRRFRAALHSLDQAVYKIIAARRKTLQPPLSKLGEGAGGEVAPLLLRAPPACLLLITHQLRSSQTQHGSGALGFPPCRARRE